MNASLVSGLAAPQFLAVFGGHLFVTNFSAGTVGEYTMSGETINTALISGLVNPTGIVVVPEPSSVMLSALAALAVYAVVCQKAQRRRGAIARGGE